MSTGEQRYRFIVSSAEQAVSVLRSRFGDRARVVSVRQVEGRGLAKFLQAPKLEVIAAVLPGPDAGNVGARLRLRVTRMRKQVGGERRLLLKVWMKRFFRGRDVWRGCFKRAVFQRR